MVVQKIVKARRGKQRGQRVLIFTEEGYLSKNFGTATLRQLSTVPLPTFMHSTNSYSNTGNET